MQLFGKLRGGKPAEERLFCPCFHDVLCLAEVVLQSRYNGVEGLHVGGDGSHKGIYIVGFPVDFLETLLCGFIRLVDEVVNERLLHGKELRHDLVVDLHDELETATLSPKRLYLLVYCQSTFWNGQFEDQKILYFPEQPNEVSVKVDVEQSSFSVSAKDGEL